MVEDSAWNAVEVTKKESEVAYEIEKEPEKPKETKASQPEVVEEVPEVPEVPEVSEEPKELDGIETDGAQKRIRHLVKQRKERDEQIQNLVQQNEQLNHQLVNREKNFTETQKASTEISEKQLENKIELARQNYIEAYQSGDGEKTLKAHESLMETQFDLQNLSNQKVALDQYSQDVERQAAQLQQKGQQQQGPDPKAIVWASENEWFGKDSVMSAAALAIDNDLKQLGLDPSTDDFYVEVSRRLHNEFPHKFDNREQSTSSTAQVVAGASRTPASSNKKVKLSSEDVRLATKWNIPLEVYAVEKQKANIAEGEYTTVNLNRRGG
jgi:hypothetical protein